MGNNLYILPKLTEITLSHRSRIVTGRQEVSAIPVEPLIRLRGDLGRIRNGQAMKILDAVKSAVNLDCRENPPSQRRVGGSSANVKPVNGNDQS